MTGEINNQGTTPEYHDDAQLGNAIYSSITPSTLTQENPSSDSAPSRTWFRDRQLDSSAGMVPFREMGVGGMNLVLEYGASDSCSGEIWRKEPMLPGISWF